MAEKKTPKILVVDDEKEIREITQTFLLLNGYEVNTAENGEDALDKLLATNYDVLITDLQMPKMGGRELLEKVFQINADAITIVLTGYAVQKTDFSREPFAHLRKPFSHNQLIQTVEQGLKDQQLKQKH